MTRIALPAALAALLLAGCSPAGRPLVQVGSQTVTVQDYERAARGAEARYEGPPEMAKSMLLDDLTRRAVMLEFAHRVGLDGDTAVLNTDRDNTRRALVQMLNARMAPGAQRVSEAEARALYAARNEEAELWLVYASTRTAALAALARLEAGEPFAAVSQAYSVPGQLPPDGNMGMHAPGSLPDPFDGVVRTQPVGVVGGPFQARDGWFLAKIARRQPREQGSYEALRAGVVELVRQRKQQAARSRAYADMKQSWRLELVPGASQLLFHINSPVAPRIPTPEELLLPLATYEGGAYTLQDALDDMRNADVQRPPFQMLPAIEIWIEGRAMTRVGVLEARRRHYDQDPDLVASLRGMREQMLLQGIYETAVASVPPPGPELVNMAWERVKDRYTNLVEVRVASVEVSDTSVVSKLVREGEKTRSLADAAKAVDPSLAVNETTVKYPSSDPVWSALQNVFTQMQPGAWFGPIPTSGQLRIVQLVDKTVSEQSFEQLPEPLQQNIAGSAGELARDARFQAFTDSLVRAYQPQVRRDLLARLPWPVKPPLDLDR